MASLHVAPLVGYAGGDDFSERRSTFESLPPPARVAVLLRGIAVGMFCGTIVIVDHHLSLSLSVQPPLKPVLRLGEGRAIFTELYSRLRARQFDVYCAPRDQFEKPVNRAGFLARVPGACVVRRQRLFLLLQRS